MEKLVESGVRGSKQLKLKKSFREGVRPLLTAVSFEDFCKAFPKFSGAEQDRLYQLYINTITCLQKNIQDEFDKLCHETQVGTILDTVEHFVEQQSLDPLFPQKSNVDQVKQDLLTIKKNEIHLLQGLLDKAEDKKNSIKAQIERLRKTSKETSGNTDAVEKLRSITRKYGSLGFSKVQDAKGVTQ